MFVPLDGTGDEIGKMLADGISDVMDTRQEGIIATREGNNGDYYGVIRAAVAVGTTGLLVEHSFHTNARSTRWLMDDNNLMRRRRQKRHLLLNTTVCRNRVISPIEALCTVCRQVLTKLNQTLMLKSRKKAAGFDAIIINENGMYKIQSGAYGIKANAERQLARLRAAEFDAFIS